MIEWKLILALPPLAAALDVSSMSGGSVHKGLAMTLQGVEVKEAFYRARHF